MVASPKSPEDPLDLFSKDPLLSPFLSPTFSPTAFSSTALSTNTTLSTTEALQSSIRLLSDHQRQHILSNHSSLLSHLHSLHLATTHLSSLRNSTSSLQQSLQLLRQNVSDPRKKIEEKTVQLSNLNEVTEIVYGVGRLLKLSRKLRELMGDDRKAVDLAKAAEMHREIEPVPSQDKGRGL